MGTVGCLDDEVIVAFAEARLSAAAVSGVAAHVRACAACADAVAQTISSLAPSTTLATVGLGPQSAGESETQAVGRRRSPRSLGRPALEAGVSIGRYTVLGLVGRGGMGEVYAAYDPDLDRKIALKVLLADASVDDRLAQERLLREAQAIAKLSHPNVVVVHDVGTFGGKIFVAMEFVQGSTLAAWLREEPRSWREIVDAFVAAARGLAAAHRAGLVHRDFKPQNVMITSDGAVRVMDFGLARRVGADAPGASSSSPSDAAEGALTRTGDQVGTPLYMAPEQFAGGVIDARSDQFSFCVALFWALYGAHPFGASAGGPSSPFRAGPMPSPSGAPASLQRVLDRGLRTDPSARWASMNDLVTALTSELRPRRRARAAAALLIGGGIALGLGGARWIEARRDPCAEGSRQVAGVWDMGAAGARQGSRREALHAAIVAAGGAESPGLWDRIAGSLDRRMEKWLSGYRTACEATYVSHEQSPEIFELRRACLNDALDSTRAWMDLLAKGAPSMLSHAAAAVGSVEELDRCSDVRQLLLGVHPPKDPLVRARVDELRRKLRHGSALFEAGDYKSARAIAEAVLPEAQSLNYCPIEAEALVLEGNADGGLLAPVDSGSLLERAIVLAESCGHDHVVAEAATQLVGQHGVRDPVAAERYARLAQAAIQRCGGDPRLEGWLENNLGFTHVFMGRLTDGQRELRHAIEIKTNHLGADHIDVAFSQANLAYGLFHAGHFEEALSFVDRALATGRRWHRPDPMILIGALNTRALILTRLGRFDEAEATLGEAGRINEGRLQVVADVLSASRGVVLLARRRPREALPLLEVALREGVTPSRFERAWAELEVAKARAAIDPADGSALDLARDAEAMFAEQPDLESQRRDAAAWIEAHQRSGGASATMTRSRLRSSRPEVAQPI